ncbi:MAG TPA: transcription termination/antitermination NusG family protein [Saprospiraceae bacterium]|nr:transcription termination/antitermination NusG family protein [Saprospiraceae bacterium]
MNHWYLIHTKPHKEKVAEQNLQRQGYKVYLPLLRQLRRRRGHWCEIIDPLFPSYLFVRLQVGQQNISPIRYTTGVRDLVRFAETGPAIVPDQIIDTLMRTADQSTGLHHLRKPLLRVGSTVFIDKGPLSGLKGIFLAETGQERVVILLEMLGRENRVTVKRDWLCLA